MSERGLFRHRERAAQLLAFEGLRWGSITPTDVDLFIDFGGRGFVIGELKYADAPVPRGQELALERMTDACRRAGVPTLTFVARHWCTSGPVRVADAEVVRYRWNGEWTEERFPELNTVARLVGRFHDRIVKGAAA